METFILSCYSHAKECEKTEITLNIKRSVTLKFLKSKISTLKYHPLKLTVIQFSTKMFNV